MNQNRIDRVVALRLEYERLRRDRANFDDPAEVIGVAAGKWLDAENNLTNAEYVQYQRQFQAQKEQTS